MSKTSQSEFGRYRRFFWPIHRHELLKLLPMLLIAFFIGFNYHIIRNIKDSMLITANPTGAEVIPFVKVWVMLPLAIIATSIFVRLSHRYRPERVFYLMVSGFLAFFLLFTFVLYPFRDVLHPHQLADAIEELTPRGLRGFVTVFRYWSFSLYYGVAELWGVIVLSVLFWGYVNDVTSINQAKRFYALIGLGANFSSIVSGQVSAAISTRAWSQVEGIGSDQWHQALIMLTLIVFIGGLLLMGCFYWLSRYVRRTEGHVTESLASTSKLRKPSIKESFRCLARSKYLVYIAIIVIGYNIAINLVEVLWKDQVRLLHPDPASYNCYMGSVTTWTGVVATLLALFVSGNVVRRFGWTVTALITPAILILTSIGFFSFYLLQGTMPPSLFGIDTLTMVVLFGGAQNVFCRASKFTVFDKTKEMAFIPLAKAERVQGKAAIDGVASRVGKSGGSLIYQALFLVFKSLSRSAPCVVALLVVTLAGWFIAIRNLGGRFAKLTQEEEVAAPAESTPEPSPTSDPSTETAPVSG